MLAVLSALNTEQQKQNNLRTPPGPNVIQVGSADIRRDTLSHNLTWPSESVKNQVTKIQVKPIRIHP